MSIPVITSQFGTLRGAVRLALTYAEIAAGLSTRRIPPPGSVRRFVFVCHGNICRSAYAEALAAAAGAQSASFGLSAETGNPAHPPIIELATMRGVDVSAHRATSLTDFQPQEGDLLLAMETRHLRRIAAAPRLARFPRVLLGSFVSPPVPHLHDPYGLDPRYMETCLDRIERAVEGLLSHHAQSPVRTAAA